MPEKYDYNNIVLCRIISEIEEIKESVSKLKQSLTAAEFSMVRLMRTKSQLENDIEVKETSLKIDAKDCMGLRKSLPKNGKTTPNVFFDHDGANNALYE